MDPKQIVESVNTGSDVSMKPQKDRSSVCDRFSYLRKPTQTTKNVIKHQIIETKHATFYKKGKMLINRIVQIVDMYTQAG